MLTFLPLEQIDEMDKWEGSQLNTAKEILAYELTKLVHGEEEAEKAQTAARALFSGQGSMENMPSYNLTAEDFTDGSIDILAVMQKSGLAPFEDMHVHFMAVPAARMVTVDIPVAVYTRGKILPAKAWL